MDHRNYFLIDFSGKSKQNKPIETEFKKMAIEMVWTPC